MKVENNKSNDDVHHRLIHPNFMEKPFFKNYVGSKNGNGVYQYLINRIPPHRVYIEPFLGSGAIMRRKRLAEVSIGLDLSRKVALNWQGLFRFEDNFRFIRGNGIKFLERYQWQGDEFVYCDPPYVMSSRKGGALYDHEMTDEQHKDLLSVLLSMCDRGVKIMVSGYWSQMYDDALSDWHYEEFQAMTRGGLATESPWMNYSPPTELHDYQYLGDEFHDRERIKKKTQRLVKKLAKLPELERKAVLNAVNERFG